MFNETNAASIIASIIITLSGLAIAFYGSKYFRHMLFFVGFYSAAISTWSILSAIEHASDSGFGAKRQLIYLLTILIVSTLAGGLLGMCLL
jgi:hypothetical protein